MCNRAVISGISSRILPLTPKSAGAIVSVQLASCFDFKNHTDMMESRLSIRRLISIFRSFYCIPFSQETPVSFPRALSCFFLFHSPCHLFSQEGPFCRVRFSPRPCNPFNSPNVKPWRPQAQKRVARAPVWGGSEKYGHRQGQGVPPSPAVAPCTLAHP